MMYRLYDFLNESVMNVMFVLKEINVIIIIMKISVLIFVIIINDL